MTDHHRTRITAHATVIKEMLPLLPPDRPPYEEPDFGLHLKPESLKTILQEAINMIHKLLLNDYRVIQELRDQEISLRLIERNVRHSLETADRAYRPNVPARDLDELLERKPVYLGL